MPFLFSSRPAIRLLAIVSLVLASCGSGASSSEIIAADPVVATDERDAVPTTLPVATTPDLGEAATTPRPTAVPPRPAAQTMANSVVALGSEGAVVEDIQDSLNDFIGYTDLGRDRISEDGIFGPNTDAAQRLFEAFVGRQVDGQSTAEDRAALEIAVASLEEDAADSVVTSGDESPFVGTWQARLNVWNELVAESPIQIDVDDRFGDDTEAATLAAERALGLQVDGIVEPEDRAALRSAISQARDETDVTTVLRSLQSDVNIVAKALYTNDQYCVRFVVGFAADERCTPGLGGDVNTAYFVTVNGVSFIGGTANPNVSFVTLTSPTGETTPVATRQMGNSLARAWASVVDAEPANIELLDDNGSSILELRFSIAPTDRTDFGSTISIISEQYSHTFFVDECVAAGAGDIAVAASLAGATLAVDIQNGDGAINIAAGTLAAPVTISGSITSASVDDTGIVFTGTFDEGVFAGDAFSATAAC